MAALVQITPQRDLGRAGKMREVSLHKRLIVLALLPCCYALRSAAPVEIIVQIGMVPDPLCPPRRVVRPLCKAVSVLFQVGENDLPKALRARFIEGCPGRVALGCWVGLIFVDAARMRRACGLVWRSSYFEGRRLDYLSAFVAGDRR